MVIGPLLQPSLNTSSELVLKLFDGSRNSYPHAYMMFVDVRDVALSHVAVYENEQAAGRFLCISCSVTYKELCQSLEKSAARVPNVQMKIPDRVKGFEPNEEPKYPPTGFYNFSNEKLQALGIVFRDLDEMVAATVDSLVEKRLFAPTSSSSL